MSELNFREASAEDLPAVAKLWGKLDAFHRQLGLAFPETEEAEQAWINSIERTLGRFSFVWLAEQDETPQAFLMGRYKRLPETLGGVFVGEISDLYVDESLRGKQVGARLVELAVKKFKELDVHSVEVQILAGNEGALEFWHKHGFEDELTQVRMVLE
ncbi:MAG: GNAT family N-acetyltransferase [Chloroflexi bacterium]|nr:GNAT family N-acetyltransferase [Chloroflexota bacterium]